MKIPKHKTQATKVVSNFPDLLDDLNRMVYGHFIIFETIVTITWPEAVSSSSRASLAGPSRLFICPVSFRTSAIKANIMQYACILGVTSSYRELMLWGKQRNLPLHAVFRLALWFSGYHILFSGYRIVTIIENIKNSNFKFTSIVS